MRRAHVIAAVVLALVSTIGGVGADLIGRGATASAACSISASVRLGSNGEAVRCLQQTLNDLGYNSGPVDGRFGQVTRRAVIAYQQAKGLFVDGVVGPQTGGSLGIWGSGGSSGGGGSTAVGSTGSGGAAAPAAPTGCAINASLRVGSGGDAVRCLQTALTSAGYAPGPIDGIFGNRTRGAVVAYQQAKGLFVDGVAGRQTGTSLGIWGTPSTPTTPPPASGAAQCTPPSGLPAEARQVVVVTSSGSRADVDFLVHDGNGWTCARMDMSGRVGSNGVRTLTDRRSGDGTTPGGTFPLGSMTAPDGQTFQFFGNGVNPGVQGSWRQVKSGDCWGATPNTADYNQLVTRTAATCTAPDEFLINFQQAYSRAAIIGANLGPGRSGDAAGEPPFAAAIFLHRTTYDAAGNSRPTSGCVSLGNDNLIFVLQRLVPGQAFFVIT